MTYMYKRVSVDRLRPGMYVDQLPGGWLQHPFWRSSFTLRDGADIERLRSSGVQEVVIDTERGLDVAEPSPAPAPESNPAAPPAPARAEPMASVPLSVELERAARIYREAKPKVMALFREARLGKAIDAAAAEPLLDEINASVHRNPAALISVARLKRSDEYTFLHSVAVAALMIALARQLGLDETATRQAGFGGLLHDIGKAQVPLEILNKPGTLTAEEFARMKKHPEYGLRVLEESAVTCDVARDVCLHHHERMDGRGYPFGLRDEQITRFAKMGAVCDVYDAITSNRPYKAGWPPAESLHRMAGWCGEHFDPAIFQAFVKSIGIYPIGSLVRLESGRLAMVVEQNESDLTAPVVKVFFSTRTNLHIAPERIDLRRSADRIVAREDPARWRFKNLDALWAGDTMEL